MVFLSTHNFFRFSDNMTNTAYSLNEKRAIPILLSEWKDQQPIPIGQYQNVNSIFQLETSISFFNYIYNGIQPDCVIIWKCLGSKSDVSFIHVANFQPTVDGPSYAASIEGAQHSGSNLILSGLHYFSQKSRIMIQCQLCYFGTTTAYCNIYVDIGKVLLLQVNASCYRTPLISGHIKSCFSEFLYLFCLAYSICGTPSDSHRTLKHSQIVNIVVICYQTNMPVRLFSIF